MTTYTLFSDAARDTALDAVGGEMMGTQDTELLKQIFVAAGNGGGGGGAYLPTAGGTMTGDITLADGVNIVIGSLTGSQIGTTTSQGLSFWGASPSIQPTVSGSRADPEEALASLISALATIGLINDTTTP